MRTVLKSNQQPRPSFQALASWLLVSEELMSPGERNRNKKTDPQIAGEALAQAIQERWKPRSDKKLADKAKVDPSTLSGLKKGFDIESQSALKVANALKVDFKKLCQGEIEDAPKEQLDEADKPVDVGTSFAHPLLEEVAEIIGTPQESQLRDYLRFIKSGSGNRKS